MRLQSSIRCFVYHDSYTDTNIIENVLRELQVEVYDLLTPPLGSSLTDPPISKVKLADCVVIVVSHEEAEASYFLGLCDGMNKPVLVLINKELKMSYFMQRHYHFETNFRDSEILRITIQQFINDVITKKYKSYRRHIVENEKDDIKNPNYIKLIQALRRHGNGYDVERVTEDFLTQAGAQLVSSRETPRGVDMAIWVDSLSDTIGNPIFIEIKILERISNDKLRETERQLAQYLDHSSAKAAIILYLDRTGQKFDNFEPQHPRIFISDLEDFMASVISSSLGQTLVRIRNKNIHGI